MRQTLRVIFDLDDTLYAERTFAHSGFRAAGAWAAAKWRVPNVAEDMQRRLDAGLLGGVFKTSLAQAYPDFTDQDLEMFIDVYRRHKPSLTLFEDAAVALEQCAAHGPLGLITDGTHWVQQSKVAALGIAWRFEKIIYTGALGGRAFHKPHPRAFELMEQALAAPDAHFVYVGDNPAKDFLAPNQRGWTSIQVVREGGIHNARGVPGDGAPRHSVNSLHDLAPVLDYVSESLA